jgi:hypothetical protein
MKPARTFIILFAITLVAMLATALAAYGGSSSDPEVGDSAGDSSTNRDSHDVIGAWIEDENNGTITFQMGMTALDAISPRDDWVNLPTSIYEYYFSIKDEDYALRSNVPVHGPFAAFTSFSLHTVDYGEVGNLSYESVSGSIQGTYVVNEAHIQFIVNKDLVGSPNQGDLITHMWAAVYFQPRNGDRDEVDTAMSYDFPGRAYTIRGQYAQLYDVRLSAENTTVEGRPRDVSTFNITIKSDSTTEVEVNLTNRTLPEGYFVNWSRQFPILVPEGGSVTVFLMVNVPENATNGTDVMVTVWGYFPTEEGGIINTDNLNLLVQVRFIKQKPPEVERNALQKAWDLMLDYWYIVFPVIALAIAAGGYYYYREWKRKKDLELIVQYQSYVDTQGQQRESGGY